MTTPAAIKTIKASLRDNPECRLGVMARTRVAFAEKGINSYQQDKELLVLISNNDGWWYGYVVRVDPGILTQRNKGEWVAILVKSVYCIEGETAEQVFRCVEHSWYWFSRYKAYYTLECKPEDGLAQYHSFEESLCAIRRMTERFSCGHHMRSEPGDGLRLDSRCYNFFASLGQSDPEMRAMHDKAELPIVEASRSEVIPPLSM